MAAGVAGDNVPVTEEEAALALVALGEPLRWERRIFSSKIGAVREAHHAGGWYGVLPSRAKSDEWTATTMPIDPAHPGEMFWGWMEEDPSPHVYRSVEDASAACERHYATGKWDGTSEGGVTR